MEGLLCSAVFRKGRRSFSSVVPLPLFIEKETIPIFASLRFLALINASAVAY